MIFITLLFVVVFLESIVANNEKQQPLLLLMSFDGFRYDFVTPKNTPNLWRLAERGVRIPGGVKCQVTTVTASNHHSMATGLYQESHGIIDNVFFDPVFNERYDVWGFDGRGPAYATSKTSKWYTGEPIWQTNMQIAGRTSGTYYWPAGDASINNVKPKHRYTTWQDYDSDFNVWKKEIDELLSWFKNPKNPVNFALYYNAEPDHLEHAADIFGSKVQAMIRQVDDLVGYLIAESQRLGLYSNLNIIITSDHGFVNTPGDFESTLALERYLNPNMFSTNSYSIFPSDNKEETTQELYRNLSRAVAEAGVKLKVWLKKDFPDRYGWKNNRRIGPVIFFYDHTKTDWRSRDDAKRRHGTHFGFLNDFTDMNVLFIAHGPAFKRNFTLSSGDVENVDYYPLMCKILGIKPSPNNGSLSRIDSILSPDFAGSDGVENDAITFAISENNNYLLELLIFLCFVLFLLFTTIFCRRLLSTRSRAKCRQVGWFRKFTHSIFDSNRNRRSGRNKDDTMPFLDECLRDV